MESSVKTNSKKRIDFLDYLRIFAFSSVLIGHKFYSDLVSLTNEQQLNNFLKCFVGIIMQLFFGGGAGVVVFFLISGYVVIHVLPHTNSLSFLIRRVFRIYPMYIIAVLMHYSIIYYNGHSSINFKYIIPQLLLIGDLFNTPHTLNGVEWTLRIEVLFYLYMYFFSQWGPKNTSNYNPQILFLVTTIALIYIMPIFPQIPISKGYFNLYAPFLFLGVFIWLYENKHINTLSILIITGVICFQYQQLSSKILPVSSQGIYAYLAILIFLICWVYRNKFKANLTIILISELTYAIYLSHNWLFDYANIFLIKFKVYYHSLFALVILFIFSAVMVRLIERPFIMAGKKVTRGVGCDKTNQTSMTKEKSVSL